MKDQLEHSSLQKAKDILKNSDAILITAGAGLGIDSGLPDFRSDNGFWKAYPPLARLGISFEEMANPKWFKDDPSFAWGFYGHRLNLYRKTIPHDGFSLLLDIASSKENSYFVFTSNVDGQFQKAGFDEKRIVECHGTIHYNQCLNNCQDDIWGNEGDSVVVDDNTFLASHPLPVCPHCKRLARPNILMFGDWQWNDRKTQKQKEMFNDWLENLKVSKAKLCVVEIGAGSAIPTVRMTSEKIADMLSGTLIRINPKEYNTPSRHIGVALGGLEGIRTIINGD